MDMEDVEDDWEVAFRPHLEKAFWTISDACTSKRLYSRSEEEQCLRNAVGRDRSNLSEMEASLHIWKRWVGVLMKIPGTSKDAATEVLCRQ